jgi:hypothetical protein
MAKRKAAQAAGTKVVKADETAAKRAKGASEPGSGFKNKEKVLVVSSRGITFR